MCTLSPSEHCSFMLKITQCPFYVLSEWNELGVHRGGGWHPATCPTRHIKSHMYIWHTYGPSQTTSECFNQCLILPYWIPVADIDTMCLFFIFYFGEYFNRFVALSSPGIYILNFLFVYMISSFVSNNYNFRSLNQLNWLKFQRNIFYFIQP